MLRVLLEPEPEPEPELTEATESVDVEEEAVGTASDMGVAVWLEGSARGMLGSFLCFGGGNFMVKSGSLSEIEVVGMADWDVMPPGVRIPGVTSPGRWLVMIEVLREEREDCFVIAGGSMLSKGLRSAPFEWELDALGVVWSAGPDGQRPRSMLDAMADGTALFLF